MSREINYTDGENNEILLSICVPTYNRYNLLKKHIHNLDEQVKNLSNRNLKVEIIVSVNPSGDKSADFMKGYLDSPNFVVNVNESNIGGQANIQKTLNLSSGKYVWITGDDDEIIKGTVEKVVNALSSFNDIGFIFINKARLNGDSADESAKLVEPRLCKLKGGIANDGKQEIIRLFKQIDLNILFSTSCVFERNSALKIIDYNHKNNVPTKNNISHQLSSIFVSCVNKKIYIIPETCIISGAAISWADSVYPIHVESVLKALLLLENFGYTRGEVIDLINYRMSHEAYTVWFEMVIHFFKEPKVVMRDYIRFLKLIPLTTLIVTLTLPIGAVYLYIRSRVRRRRRFKALNLYKLENKIPIEIQKRL